MDPEREIDVGRYVKMVAAFLFIMFAALGAYEFYYGAAARRANELQQIYQAGGPGNDSAAATSTYDGIE